MENEKTLFDYDYHVITYDVSDGHLTVVMCDEEGWELGTINAYGIQEYQVFTEAKALVASVLEGFEDYAKEAQV